MIDNIMFFMDTTEKGLEGLERLEKMGERIAKLRDRLTEERGSKYSQQNLADDANAAGFGSGLFYFLTKLTFSIKLII